MRLRFILEVKLSGVSIVRAAIPDDSYIAGYAAGVLKQGFRIDHPSLTVQDGIIMIQAETIPADERAKVLQALSEIPGITAVRVEQGAAPQPIAAAPQSIAVAPAQDEAQAKAITEEGIPAAGAVLFPTSMLPEDHLFKPLLADPGGQIFPLPTVIMSATTSMGIIMGR